MGKGIAMGPAVHRFRAIDVLRGLTLAVMIVVNMQIGPGRSYPPLLHAAWKRAHADRPGVSDVPVRGRNGAQLHTREVRGSGQRSSDAQGRNAHCSAFLRS